MVSSLLEWNDMLQLLVWWVGGKQHEVSLETHRKKGFGGRGVQAAMVMVVAGAIHSILAPIPWTSRDIGGSVSAPLNAQRWP